MSLSMVFAVLFILFPHASRAEGKVAALQADRQVETLRDFCFSVGKRKGNLTPSSRDMIIAAAEGLGKLGPGAIPSIARELKASKESCWAPDPNDYPEGAGHFLYQSYLEYAYGKTAGIQVPDPIDCRRSGRCEKGKIFSLLFIPESGAFETNHYRNLFSESLPDYSDALYREKIRAAWNRMFDPEGGEASLYRETGSEAFVRDSDGYVRTEGQSYGMMIAVQMENFTWEKGELVCSPKDVFDRLWRFAQRARQPEGYFAWRWDPAGNSPVNGDVNPAPDGEIHFCMALFFADKVWGSGSGLFSYKEQATELLRIMRRPEHPFFDPETGLVVFSPAPGANSFTDPSYHVPAFLELWSRWTEKEPGYWADAARKSRRFLRKAAAGGSHALVPDYALFDGSPFTAPPESPFYTQSVRGREFGHDAWRVGANIGMDHSWFGSWKGCEGWETEHVNRLARFFLREGEHACDRYFLDGSRVPPGDSCARNHCPNDCKGPVSTGLVAMNAVACLAVPEAALEETHVQAIRKLWNASPPEGPGAYYNGLLYLLGILQAGGEFRIPGLGKGDGLEIRPAENGSGHCLYWNGELADCCDICEAREIVKRFSMQGEEVYLLKNGLKKGSPETGVNFSLFVIGENGFREIQPLRGIEFAGGEVKGDILEIRLKDYLASKDKAFGDAKENLYLYRKGNVAAEKSHELEKLFSIDEPVRLAKFSRDGRFLAVLPKASGHTPKGLLKILECRNWTPVHEKAYGDNVHDLSFSADGKTLAIGAVVNEWPKTPTRAFRKEKTPQGRAMTLDLNKGAIIGKQVKFDRNLQRIEIDASGAHLAVASSVYEVTKKEVTIPWIMGGSRKILRDEVKKYRAVFIHDTETGNRIREINCGDHSIESLLFSPDGKFLFIGLDKMAMNHSAYVNYATVKILSAKTWKKITALHGERRVLGMAVSPDSRFFAALFKNKKEYEVDVLSLDEGTVTKVASKLFQRRYENIFFTPDNGNLLLVAEGSAMGGPNQGETHLYEAGTLDFIRSLPNLKIRDIDTRWRVLLEGDEKTSVYQLRLSAP